MFASGHSGLIHDKGRAEFPERARGAGVERGDREYSGRAGANGTASGRERVPFRRPGRLVHRHGETRNDPRHRERHRSDRIGWLRAAVLGANDGIVSTASLILGVAAAQASHASVMVAGIAGLVAGAMSMAAGEYVSVQSQADSEEAALNMERAELAADDKAERRELAAIYVGRGLDAALAKQVAAQLMAHDALGAHARDELGISDTLSARPVQAALTSAASFAVGAALPLLAVAFVPDRALIPVVSGTSLVFLAILGGVAAQVGGAPLAAGAVRVTFWGALAMALTAGVGALFGAVG
ncbi:MAG: VIT family protein [Betaproteobacteria bacterium]|nr:VIT family protein [Betaproteobacteria bacterium]